MKELCILIPTQNRYNFIDEWLKKSYAFLNEKGIDIHIYDSSQDDKTCEVCAMYDSNRVKYHKYESTDNTPDVKVRDAFAELVCEYDYIWLCGDGLLIDFGKAYPKFIAFYKKVDIIHFCYPKYNLNNINYYNNEAIIGPLDFVFNFMHSFTLYGGSIFSTSVVSELLCAVDFLRFKNSGFYPQFAILHVLNDDNKIYVCIDELYRSSDCKIVSGSGASKPGAFFPIWVASWQHCVDALPRYYEPIKDAIMHFPSRAFFSFRGLINLRYNGNLSIYLVKKYKVDLRKVLHCSMSRLYIIAVIPRSFIKFLLKIHRHFSRGTKKK